MVKPTLALFSLETQSPKEHLNIYTPLVLLRSSVEREMFLEIIKLEVLNFLQYSILKPRHLLEKDLN